MFDNTATDGKVFLVHAAIFATATAKASFGIIITSWGITACGSPSEALLLIAGQLFDPAQYCPSTLFHPSRQI
jgi:hypothetical protein